MCCLTRILISDNNLHTTLYFCKSNSDFIEKSGEITMFLSKPAIALNVILLLLYIYWHNIPLSLMFFALKLYFFLQVFVCKKTREANNWNHRSILMALVEHSKGHTRYFFIILFNKDHVLYSMKGINKQEVKSGLYFGLEVMGSVHTTVAWSSVQKTQQSLRQQRSETLIWANWCAQVCRTPHMSSSAFMRTLTLQQTNCYEKEVTW